MWFKKLFSRKKLDQNKQISDIEIEERFVNKFYIK